MKLIIGLGNPGKEYQDTRHNIGFCVIDELALAKKVKLMYKSTLYSDIGEFEQDGQTILLAKPQTYMNCSGQAVQAIVQSYKLSLEDILVVLDDIYLPVGYFRIRSTGSAGGHNGLASIVEALETDLIPRLRIGVGSPNQNELRAYVLSDFNPEELKEMRGSLQKILSVIEDFLIQDIEIVMNRYNRKVKTEIGDGE